MRHVAAQNMTVFQPEPIGIKTGGIGKGLFPFHAYHAQGFPAEQQGKPHDAAARAEIRHRLLSVQGSEGEPGKMQGIRAETEGTFRLKQTGRKKSSG